MQHQHRPNPRRLGGWCQLGSGRQLQLWLRMKMEGKTDLSPDPGMSWLLQLSASPGLAGLLKTWLMHWSCTGTVQPAMQSQINSSYLMHHTVHEGSACICPCSCLSVVKLTERALGLVRSLSIITRWSHSSSGQEPTELMAPQEGMYTAGTSVHHCGASLRGLPLVGMHNQT